MNSNPTALRKSLNSLIYLLGLAGLYLLYFGAGAGAFIAYLGLGFLFFFLIAYMPLEKPGLYRDPAIYAFAIFAVYVVAEAAQGAIALPAYTHEQWASLWPWLALWFFIPVGWTMRRYRAHIPRLLLISAIGLLIGFALHMDWGHFSAMIHGRRSDLGMTFTTAGLYSGIAFIGWTSMAARITKSVNPHRHYAHLIFWIIVEIIILECIIVTQSRAVWLSLMVIMPVAVIANYRAALRKILHSNRLTKFAIMVAVAVIAGLAASNWNIFVRRLDSGRQTINDLTQLDVRQLPKTSIGLRVYLAEFGFKQFRKKPWLGWGPGIEANHDLSLGKQQFLRNLAHLHDTYLELLVRFGVLGLALVVAFATAFLYRFITAYRMQRIPRDIFIFLMGSATLVALWNFIDFQALHADYRFMVALLLGVAYFYTLPGGDASRDGALRPE